MVHTVTLELESDSMLTKHELQKWFDQHKLHRLGIERLKVARVVTTYGLALLLEEDREDT